MTPDTAESRIGRLEREFSALKQQVHDVAHDVETLAPVQMAVVRIETTIGQVEREIAGLRIAITEDRNAAKARGEELGKEIKEMRDEQAAQSRASRTQLLAGVISIITTLLIVAGTIVASGAVK